jgi:hypothetical protein
VDPISVTVAVILGVALYKHWRGDTNPPSGLPIVIPPASPYPGPPANLAPPDGTLPITPPYPPNLSPWGYQQLKYPFGTTIIDLVDGQLIVGRIENHYHPPGMAGVTAHDWHKGLTAYRPTQPWMKVPTDVSAGDVADAAT